jgi:hypothetical protein
VPTTLPPFTAEGVLPPGDYELSLAELAGFALVAGPAGHAPTWDAAWRATLVGNLATLVRQLWAVGIDQIFADGYFECPRDRLASGDLERSLNHLDPKRCWTWDPARRRPHRGYPKRQLRMWHAYRVELYPHFGQSAGIRDECGHELTFPSAFRRSRVNGRPRGIVKIRPEVAP